MERKALISPILEPSSDFEALGFTAASAWAGSLLGRANLFSSGRFFSIHFYFPVGQKNLAPNVVIFAG